MIFAASGNLPDTVINSKLQSLPDTPCCIVNMLVQSYIALKMRGVCAIWFEHAVAFLRTFSQVRHMGQVLCELSKPWITIIASNCRLCSLFVSWQPKYCNCCLVKITSDVKPSPAGAICLLAIFACVECCRILNAAAYLIWPSTYLGACAPSHPCSKG